MCICVHVCVTLVTVNMLYKNVYIADNLFYSLVKALNDISVSFFSIVQHKVVVLFVLYCILSALHN